jgi:putative membrane protein
MHLFWWIFWVVLLVVVFGVLTPVPRGRARETPLQILQRRYAQGELSSQGWLGRLLAGTMRDGVHSGWSTMQSNISHRPGSANAAAVLDEWARPMKPYRRLHTDAQPAESCPPARR